VVKELPIIINNIIYINIYYIYIISICNTVTLLYYIIVNTISQTSIFLNKKKKELSFDTHLNTKPNPLFVTRVARSCRLYILYASRNHYIRMIFVRSIRASMNCPLKCLFTLYMLYLIRYHIEKFLLDINETAININIAPNIHSYSTFN